MKEKNLLYFISQKKLFFILSIIFAIFSAFFTFLPYLMAAKIIVNLFNQGRTLSIFLIDLLVLIISSLLAKVCHAVSTYLSHVGTFKVINEIRTQSINKIAKAPLGVVQSRNLGTYKNLIVDVVEQLEPLLAHMTPDITANLLIPIFIYVNLIILDWRMGLATLGSIVIGIFAFSMMMRGYQPEYKKYVLANRKMNAAIVEYIHGIKEIKTFNQTSDAFKTYQSEIINFRDTTLHWWQQVWRYYSILLAVTPNTILFALPFGGWLFITHQISMGIFVTSLLLGLALVSPLLQVVNYTDNFAMVNSAMKQVSQLLTLPVLKENTVFQTLDWSDGIRLNHVSFSYQKTPALKDVSLRLKPKSITALVGESGSGKTTLIRLLMRFFDTDQGEVLLGKVNVKNMPLKQLMSNISYVAQDNFLFNTSIRNNLKMGNPNATEAQIEQAADLAGCHDFIMAQPQGYDTVVGSKGNRLSGGQRQRLTIARAFLHKAPILILDEATAALDTENESLIQAAINRLAKDKIVIIIAHHLNVIRHVDQIVVMSHGQVVGCGCHEKLLATNPIYKKLWQNYLSK